MQVQKQNEELREKLVQYEKVEILDCDGLETKK